MLCSFCKLEKDDSCFEAHSSGSLRKQCRSCVSARRAKYYQRNKESIGQKTKEYAQTHIEQANCYKKKWVERNPEKRRDSLRLSEQRRRAAKRNVEYEYFSKSDVLEKWGNHCFYCNGDFEHIDHYIPLSKGGSHTLDNVRPSCASCNQKKYVKMPDEFERLVNFG